MSFLLLPYSTLNRSSHCRMINSSHLVKLPVLFYIEQKNKHHIFIPPPNIMQLHPRYHFTLYKNLAFVRQPLRTLSIQSDLGSRARARTSSELFVAEEVSVQLCQAITIVIKETRPSSLCQRSPSQLPLRGRQWPGLLVLSQVIFE